MKMYCINHVFTEFLNSATAGGLMENELQTFT